MTFNPDLHASTLKSERASRIEAHADPAFTPQVGALVDMLVYARLTTLQAVSGLTTGELDFIPAGFSNSIGMLLAHIAAVHRIYHGLSFQARDLLAEGDPSFMPYAGALSMGEQGEKVRGHDLNWYLRELQEASDITYAELARRDDNWLASRFTFPGWDTPNHHWAWFHVMEDEVSHRGQMRLIRKNLPNQAK